MKKILFFILLFSNLIFSQENATIAKLQQMSNIIDSLISVNLNNKVDSATVKNLIREYLNEISSETSNFTLQQIDEAIFNIRNLINMGYETSIYKLTDIDKSVTDVKNKIWFNMKSLPSDSTGLQSGDLYFNNKTGAIKRKF